MIAKFAVSAQEDLILRINKKLLNAVSIIIKNNENYTTIDIAAAANSNYCLNKHIPACAARKIVSVLVYS